MSGQGDFSQGGFQEQFSILQGDMSSLKEQLQNAQSFIQSALNVYQKAEMTPGYWANPQNRGEVSQNQGFTPQEQAEVPVLREDVTALRQCVTNAKNAMDQAALIVGKEDFGPESFSQGGFS